MKLSDIRGERVIDVIAEIADPFLTIAMDEEASAFFKREKCPEGEEPVHFVMRRLKKSVPALLGGHKDEIIAIMSALKDVSREEYLEELTMSSLLTDLYEMLTDEELLAFLS